MCFMGVCTNCVCACTLYYVVRECAVCAGVSRLYRMCIYYVFSILCAMHTCMYVFISECTHFIHIAMHTCMSVNVLKICVDA